MEPRTEARDIIISYSREIPAENPEKNLGFFSIRRRPHQQGRLTPARRTRRRSSDLSRENPRCLQRAAWPFSLLVSCCPSGRRPDSRPQIRRPTPRQSRCGTSIRVAESTSSPRSRVARFSSDLVRANFSRWIGSRANPVGLITRRSTASDRIFTETSRSRANASSWVQTTEIMGSSTHSIARRATSSGNRPRREGFQRTSRSVVRESTP